MCQKLNLNTMEREKKFKTGQLLQSDLTICKYIKGYRFHWHFARIRDEVICLIVQKILHICHLILIKLFDQMQTISPSAFLSAEV